MHHITFSGVTVEASDFTNWYRHGWVGEGDSGENHQYPIYDRQIEMTQHRTGMVFMRNTDHITITRSHLRNSGYSAIYMLFYNQNNRVELLVDRALRLLRRSSSKASTPARVTCCATTR